MTIKNPTDLITEPLELTRLLVRSAQMGMVPPDAPGAMAGLITRLRVLGLKTDEVTRDGVVVGDALWVNGFLFDVVRDYRGLYPKWQALPVEKAEPTEAPVKMPKGVM